MSVKVSQLTKTYGSQRAVDEISFEARPGEVLGFLGPNGAGKSTTMKIISCFIPPTEGEVSVCGFDIAESSEEVRKHIGYLPENNPLYVDMYVREYLGFIAGLHKLSNAGQRVGEMIALTGLEREQHKPIRALSKGYRQRVGLAQALLHNPPVLILDEPTSGLDPNQLAEIRALIKDLGKEKTIIFSSHIMQEVQAICDRVVIINKGRIVANDPIRNLTSRLQGSQSVMVEFTGKTTADKLQEIPGVIKAVSVGGTKWRLDAAGDQDVRPSVFNFAVENKLILLEMRMEELEMEEVFRSLTAEKTAPAKGKKEAK
ncbi:MAG TPA: gliding motility-associated ABC transporter ATP-binding subunit GldA [Flavilitoribacter sp.]|nr:gliding motility-associated ABC transporter ATP-binding subunit GldA [Flavilitoribacter sp.]